MDTREKKLTDAYNKAVDELNRCEKGSIAAIIATAKLAAAHKKLKAYKASQHS